MPQPPDDAEALRSFIAQRDVPCPSCGYNLRGLASDRCPECNQELALRVHLTEPRLAAWVAGLLGLSLGTGFSGLLVVFGVLAWFIRGWGGPPARDLAIIAAACAVESVLLSLWIVRGRAIRRAATHRRHWLVAGCWLATVIAFLAVVLTIR